jgi:hypothetical protein
MNILEKYALELRESTLGADEKKRREMWRDMGPRIWARFGHDPANPWKPSAGLDEIIRRKPPSKAEQEAA